MVVEDDGHLDFSDFELDKNNGILLDGVAVIKVQIAACAAGDLQHCVRTRDDRTRDQ